MKYDWDKLSANLQKDALTDSSKKNYETDERFYKLARDDKDNGGALIRFVVDKDDVPFIKMTKINARQTDGSKRFVAEWSPLTIGLKDPFNEKFLEYWSKGEIETAKKYSRAFRYITNIYIVKDPSTPANEGKYFLMDMSPTLFAKLKDSMLPPESEIALGAKAKEVYNPVKGNNFLLKVGKAATGFLSYETSKFNEAESGIFPDDATAEKEIKQNTYSLNDFLKPENFLSYDELVEKLRWFDGAGTTQGTQGITEADLQAAEGLDEMETPAAKPKTPKTVKETKTVVVETVVDDMDELDDLLNLMD